MYILNQARSKILEMGEPEIAFFGAEKVSIVQRSFFDESTKDFLGTYSSLERAKDELCGIANALHIGEECHFMGL